MEREREEEAPVDRRSYSYGYQRVTRAYTRHCGFRDYKLVGIRLTNSQGNLRSNYEL